MRMHHLTGSSLPKLGAVKSTNRAATRIEPSSRAAPADTSDTAAEPRADADDRPLGTMGQGQPTTSTGTAGRWSVTTITRTPATPAESSASAPQRHSTSSSPIDVRRHAWYVVLLLAALLVVLAIRAFAHRGVHG